MLRRIQRDTATNAHSALRTVPLFLLDLKGPLIFWKDFSKNTQISHFINIRPLGAQLIHADGRTDKQTWWS